MTALDIVEFLKGLYTEISTCCSAFSVDGNNEKYVGVFKSKMQIRDHICIGGLKNTNICAENYEIYIRWTSNPTVAEIKANELYNNLKQVTENQFILGNTTVYKTDVYPPMWSGKDEKGIYEYRIDMNFITERK